jgi:hypothetical protein
MRATPELWQRWAGKLQIHGCHCCTDPVPAQGSTAVAFLTGGCSTSRSFIRMSATMHFRRASVCGLLIFATGVALAQPLPVPSRTVFKCIENGKTVYSDSPCLGAQKIDVEPTRGVNSGPNGRELVGPDVRREKNREAMAEALRPITGLNAKQYEVQGRRMKLEADAQRECRYLDASIPTTEADEKHATKTQLPEVQARLLTLRKRFRELRC